MVAPPVEQPVTAPASAARIRLWPLSVPALLAGLAFVVLFITPFRGLAAQWWNDPDSGHGLLLFPVAIWLAWREGIDPEARRNVRWGVAILIAAILLRAIGSAAAELFTQRFSIWLAAVGLVVYQWGWVQIRRWWLPVVLLPLSIPLPAIVTDALATPLQFRASKLATAMIRWRQIPVQLTGNVIHLRNATLFVAEACSGLRSLTALLSLGVLIGGMYLRSIPSRVLLVFLAIPVAVFVNAARIFLTAFLVHFVDPKLAQGAMHRNEGWAMFMIAFLILGAVAAVVRFGEYRIAKWRGRDV
jgi:exosortase